MPYILPDDRELYTKHLDAVLEEFSAGAAEDDLGGHLNFCISYLLTKLFEDEQRYVRINTLMGALEGAKLEFYRFHVAPYEDKKRCENGDV